MGMKRLVVLTFTSFALIVILSCYLNKSHLSPAIDVEHEGHPTVGNREAKVHVVIFEEPKCINCHRFNQAILPRLKKEFIDEGKITLTIIPVSFLPNSMPAAEALYCVYDPKSEHPNDELFFIYLDYMFNHQPGERQDWATEDKLLEMAKEASPEIDLSQLKECISDHRYQQEIEKNGEYGKKLMGELATPMVYVNGVRLEELNYATLEELIRDMLSKAE